MAYPIENKIVVAVSATALFDLSKEHELFLELGVDKFREHQKRNRHVVPNQGAAFPFIHRLLHLN